MSVNRQGGFTMVELLVAMSVFSFMLLLIVMGFMNVVRLHNQAIASNDSQDNARGAISELVRAIRDSAGVVTPVTGSATSLCLANASGPQLLYRIDPAENILYRYDNCATPVNRQAITSPAVKVTNFVATVNTSGAAIVKPQIDVTVTVASNNGTTTGSGASVACGPTNADRTFCSTVTLTSGAVPR